MLRSPDGCGPVFDSWYPAWRVEVFMTGRPNHRGPSQVAQAYQTAHEAMSIGLTLGALVGGGYWLDQYLSISPVFLITGTLCGFLACGFSLRAMLRRLDRQSRKNTGGGSSPGDSHSEQ